MSRVYDYASEGKWCSARCARCDGDNQQKRKLLTGALEFWWANPTETFCGLCRCEIEAEEQQIADEMAAMQARDEHTAQEEV